MGVISVGVVGFRWACWKCKDVVHCVVGPYCYGDDEIQSGDRAMEIAREILNQADKTEIAALLVPSRYANGSRGELASHCGSCGAVQGNHYVQQHALNALINSCGDIKTLDLIADGSCDEATWLEMVSDEWSGGIRF